MGSLSLIEMGKRGGELAQQAGRRRYNREKGKVKGQQVNMCLLMYICNYQENKVNKGLEAFTTSECRK